MSEIAALPQAILETRDISALELFLDGISRRLREGRGLEPTSSEAIQGLLNPELSRCLTMFTNNARRLPASVHGRLATALNRDQIPSKLWLVEQLYKIMPLHESRVLVVGGWYGILPLLLRCIYPSARVRIDLVDVDCAACEVATVLLNGVVEDVTIVCKDAKDLDYHEFRRDPGGIVVNTVCEHMSDFVDWFDLIQPGQPIALQSNDHVGCSEHTNCVGSLEAFEAQAPLSKTFFRGVLPLANFKRFMLIGNR